MSLLTRVWLVVMVAMVLALTGNFTLSVLTARDYLAQQLFAQASDSATSLALSMSQQSKDAAMSELLVSALFDAGHFESITYHDVGGKLVVARHNTARIAAAPGWFIAALPLASREGEALVSNGWRQAGVVRVKASADYAYSALWQGVLKLAATQLALGILLGVALTLLLRWAWAPLQAIVRQAVAIGQRRFEILPTPNVPELRVVGRAMNGMVERVRAMFAEQAERISSLRDEANRDALTLLPNRNMFVAHLKGALQDEGAATHGGVLVLRLLDLAGVNRRLGREETDALIVSAAQRICALASEYPDFYVGRLNGADFALLLEGAGAETLQAMGRKLLSGVGELYRQGMSDRESNAAIGATLYSAADSVGAVLLRADNALMQAETMGPALLVSLAQGDTGTPRLAADWREEIDAAVAAQAFELAAYPVVQADGSLLHQEVMLRLRNRRGQMLTAGQFMPAVMRLARTAEIDLLAVEAALSRLAQSGQGEVAANISPLSLEQPTFIHDLGKLLAAQPLQAERLWLEVSERGLESSHGFAALTELAELASSHRVRVGIEHFGRHFSALPQLYALALDYIKLDGAFVVGIDQHPGNQRFVKAVVDVARSMALMVIAERVGSQAEWEMLKQLGVKGVTGPYVTETLKSA